MCIRDRPWSIRRRGYPPAASGPGCCRPRRFCRAGRGIPHPAGSDDCRRLKPPSGPGRWNPARSKRDGCRDAHTRRRFGSHPPDRYKMCIRDRIETVQQCVPAWCRSIRLPPERLPARWGKTERQILQVRDDPLHLSLIHISAMLMLFPRLPTRKGPK